MSVLESTGAAPRSGGQREPLARRAKQAVNRYLPGLAYRVRARRRRRAFVTAHGGAEFRAKNALVAAHGKRVLSGPFAGMAYGDYVACSAYVAKLVGSYEAELHGAIERLVARGYDRVVDVGSAEGYYAIGLARRLPAAQVYAFDADPDAQRMCREMAALNGVAARVAICGWCDHAELDRLAGPSSLVVCDCEGYEAELLDPSRAPRLAETDVLVELHDVFYPGLTAALLARFAETHDVELMDTRPRDAADYPVLEAVAHEDRYWAVREGRHGEMQWALLTARRRG